MHSPHPFHPVQLTLAYLHSRRHCTCADVYDVVGVLRVCNLDLCGPATPQVSPACMHTSVQHVMQSPTCRCHLCRLLQILWPTLQRPAISDYTCVGEGNVHLHAFTWVKAISYVHKGLLAISHIGALAGWWQPRVKLAHGWRQAHGKDHQSPHLQVYRGACLS